MHVMKPVATVLVAVTLAGVRSGRTSPMPVQNPRSGSPATAAQPAVPFTALLARLLVVHDNPRLADEADVIGSVEWQVMLEQGIWKWVAPSITACGPGAWCLSANPTSPLLFEWQVLADQKSARATELLDAFLAGSMQLGDGPGVFLFARSKVEGREPRFAAQELVSVYRQHLKMAAAKVPRNLSFSIPLPPYAYDFDLKALKFEQTEQPRSAGRSVDSTDLGIDLLHSADSGSWKREMPEQTLATANYVAIAPAGDSSANTPTAKWREFAKSTLPSVEVLATDRQLWLPPLRLDAAAAEKLSKKRAKLHARLLFRADRVIETDYTYSQRQHKYAILFARVDALDVLDDEDGLVSSFHAGDLKAPSHPSTVTPPARSPSLQARDFATKEMPQALAYCQNDRSRSGAFDCNCVQRAIYTYRVNHVSDTVGPAPEPLANFFDDNKLDCTTCIIDWKVKMWVTAVARSQRLSQSAADCAAETFVTLLHAKPYPSHVNERFDEAMKVCNK